MEELTDTGLDVRNAYVQYRRLLHPEYDPPPKYNEIWNKIASSIIKAEVSDIGRFMEVNFNAITPFPYPNALQSYNAIKRYKDNKIDNVDFDKVLQRLEFENRYYASRRKLGFSVEDLLNDEDATLSVLFKYYIALKEDLHSYVKKYEEHSKRLLERDINVKKVYGGLLELLYGR